MKSILLVVLILLNIQANETQPPPSLVEVMKVKEGYVNSQQNYVGTLYYDRNSNLASETSGVVNDIYIKEGQSVKNGEVLLKLESSILEAKINAKNATLDSMLSEQSKQKKELDRSVSLLKKKSISQSSYDTTFYTLEALNSQIDSQREVLRSMTIELEKKTIKAPYDAIVVKRDVDIGEWVAVGNSVFTIVDPKSIEARISIPSTLLNTLTEDQKFEAKINGKDIEVSLKSIIPLANKSSRTFPVKLSFESQNNLIEGMRIDVKVPTLKSVKALLIPRDAVIKRFGNFVVFTVVDGKAIMIPVNVINYTHNQAAVAATGLKVDMKVIIKGNERVFPNMPVVEKIAK